MSQQVWHNKDPSLLNRGETIHLPCDTIRIAIFHYDTVIFDTIHSSKIKLKRKLFPLKTVFNNKKLMLTINTKSFLHTVTEFLKTFFHCQTFGLTPPGMLSVRTMFYRPEFSAKYTIVKFKDRKCCLNIYLSSFSLFRPTFQIFFSSLQIYLFFSRQFEFFSEICFI